ncbi:hypothetical protein GCM10010421_08820 [Streptomyces glaucus]|uniref:Uncharacterized protein n=1 Tax=Streptomyces glaucus TaxID=284029 RepID=A0ABP5WCC7_9ACTN
MAALGDGAAPTAPLRLPRGGRSRRPYRFGQRVPHGHEADDPAAPADGGGQMTVLGAQGCEGVVQRSVDAYAGDLVQGREERGTPVARPHVSGAAPLQ